VRRRRRFRLPFRDARRIARDVDAEVDLHLELSRRALEKGGLEPEEARREALHRFGDVKRAKRELRAMDESSERRSSRREWWLDLGRDLRHGARVLRRRPAFAALAVGTLALGIGGTAAIFGVVWGLLLQPLPYGEAERIVALWRPGHWSAAEFEVAGEAAQRFDALAAWAWDGQTLREGGGPARLAEGVVATDGLFTVLAARPHLGRALQPGDSRPGAEAVVVLSHRLWREQFGSDPDVLGRTVLMNGRPRTVVGIMPRDFFFPTPQATYWIPLTLDPADAAYSGNHWLRPVGRLAPGVTADDPGLLAPIVAALGERFDYPPQWDKTRDASVEPIRRRLLGEQRPALLLLTGVVGLILVMACANVAALLLGRTVDRRAELAVRASLGASRWRLGRQLVGETLVLGLLAGAIGAGLAALGFRALLRLLPLDPAVAGNLEVDWSLLAAALVLALGTGVAVAVVPILGVLRGRLREALGARQGRGGSSVRGRLQGGLVIVQVTLAVILVAGASVLARSLARISTVDVGFEAGDVLVVDVFAGSGDLDMEQRRRFVQDAAERMSQLPGVVSAAAINRLPVRDGGFNSGAVPSDRELPGAAPTVWWRLVTPDYFRTMGIRLLRGRGLERGDDRGAPNVAVINETMARVLWPGEDPIGKRYRAGIDVDAEIMVVGVVEDVRLAGVREPPVSIAYRPYEQASFVVSQSVLVIKSRSDAALLAGRAREVVQQLDPAVAVPRVGTLERILSDALADASRITTFVALFAALALVLGSIGVYGVVSYAVVRRRQELGIRLALGSTPRRLLRQVMWRGLVLALAGLVLGLAGLTAGAGLLRRFIHDTAPLDPASLVAAAVILLGTALLASWLPARRAATLDPSRALRAE